MSSHPEISVIGGGVVGRAIAAYYKDVKIYDKYVPRDPIEAAAAADYIFIAVPTPFKNGQDLSEMDNAITKTVKHLRNPSGQILIIKSTVLPGTTDAYQAKFPDVNLVFNPEFLTERTAEADFAHSDKQLVGFTERTKDLANKVMEILPKAPYQKAVPAKVAEMVKYFINSFYAFKVIFANQIYDLCQALGIDYAQIREGLVADKRIVDTHFEVMHDGYRGYGGKCLRKDVQTLAWLAKKHNVDFRFIEEIIALNEKLISQKT